MKKLIALQEVIDFLGPDIIDIFGNVRGIYINNLKSSSSVGDETLDWINPTRDEKQLYAESSSAKVILVDEDVQYTDALKSKQKTLIVVANPKFSLLRVGNRFFAKKPLPGIHGTALMHPAAKTYDDLYVGAHASIGECIIGSDVVIYPNVVINDGVVIGNHVVIKPGAILGFDGFGYERDLNNNWVKFPQLGRLIIHDYVEIGSHSCIDKGSLSDTIIGFNTKINNLCHVAHNVVIGKNVIITAHVNISGSTIIEDDVWIAPNASFRGHQRVGRGSAIGIGAVVTKDVPAGETWIGNPAKKIDK